MRYEDEVFRYSFDVPAEWRDISTHSAPTVPRVKYFRTPGGMVEVTIAEVQDHLVDPTARLEELVSYVQAEGYTNVRPHARSLGDETNCVYAEYRKGPAIEAMLSAVRDGIQYLVRYTGDLCAGERCLLDAACASFRLAPPERVRELRARAETPPSPQELMLAQLLGLRREDDHPQKPPTRPDAAAMDAATREALTAEMGDRIRLLIAERDWRGARRCLEELLPLVPSPLARAVVQADIMETYVRENDPGRALAAGAAASETLREHGLNQTPRGAKLLARVEERARTLREGPATVPRGAAVAAYLLGAAAGAVVGSFFVTSAPPGPTDLRYGGAGIGGIVGVLVLLRPLTNAGPALAGTVCLAAAALLVTMLTAPGAWPGLGVLAILGAMLIMTSAAIERRKIALPGLRRW